MVNGTAELMNEPRYNAKSKDDTNSGNPPIPKILKNGIEPLRNAGQCCRDAWRCEIRKHKMR